MEWVTLYEDLIRQFSHDKSIKMFQSFASIIIQIPLIKPVWKVGMYPIFAYSSIIKYSNNFYIRLLRDNNWQTINLLARNNLLTQLQLY